MKSVVLLRSVRGRNAAFTLIELLAAVAIVGVLTALLFTVGNLARERGESITCASNLRQMGVALRLFESDHKGRLPSSSHLRAADGTSLSWINTLVPYLGPDFIGRCPSAPEHPAKVTYALNDLLTDLSGEGMLLTSIRSPSATLAIGEIALAQSSEHFHFAGAARGRITAASFKSSVNVECHGRGANYLFVDAHVEPLAWTEVQRRLADANNPFLKP
jgi:prepilin-type N-terminal cleavage/methylation domain-containing protein/prepilin-type processing-associated H-X9-DG protein